MKQICIYSKLPQIAEVLRCTSSQQRPPAFSGGFRFGKWGVPPVIIHFERWYFRLKKTQPFLGYPHGYGASPVTGELGSVSQDTAGLHVLMCCASGGSWQLALELMARHEDVMRPGHRRWWWPMATILVANYPRIVSGWTNPGDFNGISVGNVHL